jgi:bis(5'-nucleosidyl)-tetraphosphatase
MRREWHHSAGVIVFREDSPRSYLLMRSALTRRPVWEFPKGAIEDGETELEAAERELSEETGLSGGDYTILDGFREEERGEVQVSREASRHEWVTLEEALRMLRFPEKRRVLARAEEWLAQRQAQPG